MKKTLTVLIFFTSTFLFSQTRIYFKDNTFKDVKEIKVRKKLLIYEDTNGNFINVKKNDYDFYISTSIAKHIDTSYFNISDGKLIWQKVFYKEKKDLMNYFIKQVISNIEKDNLQKIDNRISFEIKSDVVDYRKYGGTWGNTLSHIKVPLYYLVVIDFKENRYRVTINSIKSYFGNNLGFLKLNDVALKKGVFNEQKMVVRGLKYLNIHFVKKFLLNDDFKEDW